MARNSHLEHGLRDVPSLLRSWDILCQSDHTMFVKHSFEGKMVVLIVYVDDIVITGDEEER